jgi:hypothetical protein
MWLLLGQGIYYLVTGVWPIISIGSFQRVTGPKTDLWLVKTVGVLVSVIGAVLLIGGGRRARGPEMPVLSVGSAAGLAAIDSIYVARRRIPAIYLADALAELALIVAWAVLGYRRFRDRA